MGDINTVCISGRLGDDPEVKYFESGSIKVSFSIGVNRYSSKKQAEEVTWHKVIAWGKRAEFIGDVAKKRGFSLRARHIRKRHLRRHRRQHPHKYLYFSE